MNPLRLVKNVLIWVDIGVNVFPLMSRKPVTLSERAAEARDKGKAWGKALCKILDVPDKGHCDASNPDGPL